MLQMKNTFDFVTVSQIISCLLQLKKSQIKLPATSEEKPDWEFMENYIKSLPYTKNLEPTKNTRAIPYS